MITLCGFAISNYYNVVKMAMLEKSIPFAEEYVATKSEDEAVLASSPLGKIPFIRTPQGSMCESHAILEYLEAAYPGTALLPTDAFAAGKVRELMTFIDMHLELVARELYAQARLMMEALLAEPLLPLEDQQTLEQYQAEFRAREEELADQCRRLEEEKEKATATTVTTVAAINRPGSGLR